MKVRTLAAVAALALSTAVFGSAANATVYFLDVRALWAWQLRGRSPSPATTPPICILSCSWPRAIRPSTPGSHFSFAGNVGGTFTPHLEPASSQTERLHAATGSRFSNPPFNGDFDFTLSCTSTGCGNGGSDPLRRQPDLRHQRDQPLSPARRPRATRPSISRPTSSAPVGPPAWSAAAQLAAPPLSSPFPSRPPGLDDHRRVLRRRGDAPAAPSGPRHRLIRFSGRVSRPSRQTGGRADCFAPPSAWSRSLSRRRLSKRCIFGRLALGGLPRLRDRLR